MRVGKEKKSVSTEVKNKATFRRYIEEVWNRTNLEVVDEIFDRYLSHQPDGPTLQRGPEDVKRFVSEFRSAFSVFRFSEKGKVVESWDSYYSQLGLMRQSMEQELRLARSIQQAFLPKEVPTLEGWQISPLYQPAREVGGDFYDFHPLSGGRLGLVVGDATGKGVPAALVMSTTCGMLRAVSQASHSSSPGEMLERVNEALVPSIPANMFVTCFYA